DLVAPHEAFGAADRVRGLLRRLPRRFALVVDPIGRQRLRDVHALADAGEPDGELEVEVVPGLLVEWACELPAPAGVERRGLLVGNLGVADHARWVPRAGPACVF